MADGHRVVEGDTLIVWTPWTDTMNRVKTAALCAAKWLSFSKTNVTPHGQGIHIRMVGLRSDALAVHPWLCFEAGIAFESLRRKAAADQRSEQSCQDP